LQLGWNAHALNPQELQNMLDVEAARSSRKRAWENLQESRWLLKDVTDMELPPPARKTIDLEGRIVKDGVRKATQERQIVLADLVHAISGISEVCRNYATNAPRFGLRSCHSRTKQGDWSVGRFVGVISPSDANPKAPGRPHAHFNWAVVTVWRARFDWAAALSVLPRWEGSPPEAWRIGWAAYFPSRTVAEIRSLD
jgi:hypothetical protein